LEFLIERHAQYSSGEQLKPDALGELFSETWTREAVDDVVKKGAAHLTQVKYYTTLVLNFLPYTSQSYRLWDVQRDWELEILETAPESERHAF
jgi:squamous cell carcinoma antigen recognized by T-cells 3